MFLNFFIILKASAFLLFLTNFFKSEAAALQRQKFVSKSTLSGVQPKEGDLKKNSNSEYQKISVKSLSEQESDIFPNNDQINFESFRKTVYNLKNEEFLVNAFLDPETNENLLESFIDKHEIKNKKKRETSRMNQFEQGYNDYTDFYHHQSFSRNPGPMQGDSNNMDVDYSQQAPYKNQRVDYFGSKYSPDGLQNTEPRSDYINVGEDNILVPELCRDLFKDYKSTSHDRTQYGSDQSGMFSGMIQDGSNCVAPQKKLIFLDTDTRVKECNETKFQEKYFKAFKMYHAKEITSNLVSCYQSSHNCQQAYGGKYHEEHHYMGSHGGENQRKEPSVLAKTFKCLATNIDPSSSVGALSSLFSYAKDAGKRAYAHLKS